MKLMMVLQITIVSIIMVLGSNCEKNIDQSRKLDANPYTGLLHYHPQAKGSDRGRIIVELSKTELRFNGVTIEGSIVWCGKLCKVIKNEKNENENKIDCFAKFKKDPFIYSFEDKNECPSKTYENYRKLEDVGEEYYNEVYVPLFAEKDFYAYDPSGVFEENESKIQNLNDKITNLAQKITEITEHQVNEVNQNQRMKKIEKRENIKDLSALDKQNNAISDQNEKVKNEQDNDANDKLYFKLTAQKKSLEVKLKELKKNSNANKKNQKYCLYTNLYHSWTIQTIGPFNNKCFTAYPGIDLQSEERLYMALTKYIPNDFGEMISVCGKLNCVDISWNQHTFHSMLTCKNQIDIKQNKLEMNDLQKHMERLNKFQFRDIKMILGPCSTWKKLWKTLQKIAQDLSFHQLCEQKNPIRKDGSNPKGIEDVKNQIIDECGWKEIHTHDKNPFVTLDLSFSNVYHSAEQKSATAADTAEEF